MLTLEDVMSGEVHNRMCSCIRRVGPRASRFMEAYEIPKTMVNYVLIS